jgi:hypothetical protein
VLFFLTSTLGHPNLKTEQFCQFFLTLVQ